MQCRLPRTIKPLFDVALSGTFDSSYGYVTIDGTTYTSAQTLKVAKGTSVAVLCSASSSTGKKECIIRLNGTKVAQGTKSSPAEYTLAVTDNCTVVLSKDSSAGHVYYYANITMPA